ncbi:mechanosensitive ion channel domain-containing protein [Campylobacterota bacterium]
MRFILFFLLLTHIAFSAEIDKNLFEGDNQEAYHKEIEAKIIASIKSGQVPQEITKEEQAFLSKLRNELEQKISIEKHDLSEVLKQKNISQDTFQDSINALTKIRLKIDKYHQSIKRLQSKVSYSKHKIENITEDEKAYLLSYQLQFAFYKVQQKNHETKEQLLEAHSHEIIQAVKNSLSSVKCYTVENLDLELATSDSQLVDLEKKRILIELDREKALVDESKEVESLQKKWIKVNNDYEDALVNKVVLQTYKAVCLLKEENNKAFFDLLEEIEESIDGLSEEQQTYFGKHKEILKEIAKDVFGRTRLFLGATQHELLDMFSQVKEYTVSTLFVFNEQPISILSLVKMVLLIIISFVVGGFYKRWIMKISRRWPDMSQMSIRLTSNIGYYIIVFIGVMIALSSIGIDMTSISLIAGALSIGIGFGLQTVVSNLIAGIILMFERTVRIGDTIEISDTLKGRVTDMRIRSTTIQTFDNVDIVVPNASFIQNNVINWTLEDKTRRLHIPFGVAYGTEVEDVRKAVLEELEQSDLIYIKHDADKVPEVWMIAMNSSSVDFELLVWVEWANKFRPNALRSEFLILIYNALRKNNIQIPFPQLDLHVKDVSQILK